MLCLQRKREETPVVIILAKVIPIRKKKIVNHAAKENKENFV